MPSLSLLALPHHAAGGAADILTPGPGVNQSADHQGVLEQDHVARIAAGRPVHKAVPHLTLDLQHCATEGVVALLRLPPIEHLKQRGRPGSDRTFCGSGSWVLGFNMGDLTSQLLHMLKPQMSSNEFK